MIAIPDLKKFGVCFTIYATFSLSAFSQTNASASFSVTATGTAPLSYQWYFNTNAIGSASPSEWIDPDTGHRIVQLSTEPGSESLYFNLNPFTPDGKRMVITTPNGISMINLQTREVEKIVDGRVNIIMVGRKTGQIYYVRRKIENGATNRIVCATDPNTKTTREILTLARGESVATVNADETLLGGTITERNDWDEPRIFCRRPEPFDGCSERRRTARQKRPDDDGTPRRALSDRTFFLQHRDRREKNL